MKVIGVEIDGAKANFIGLVAGAAEILAIPEVPKSLKLGDDKDFNEVRHFKELLHNLFSAFSPDIIGIYKKTASGKFAAGPLTYKVEGLIQLYEGSEMQFVDPKSIAALKRRKTYEVKYQHNYQEKAADVAYYLIQNNE